MRPVKVSLRVKFSLILMIFSIGILLYNFIVTGSSILNRNQAFLAGAMLQDTVKLVDYFSSTVNDGLVLDDDILLIKAFDRIKAIDSIDHAILYGKDRNIRFHSEVFAKRDMKMEDEAYRRIIKMTNLSVYPEFNAGDIRSSYLISKAFYETDGVFSGALVVKYSTATLGELVKKIRNDIILNMIIILVTSIVFAVLIGFVITTVTLRPILSIAKGIEIVGKGDLDYVIPVMRNDELGFLSDQFNSMTLKIKNAQKVMLEKKQEEEQMQIAKEIQESIFPERSLIEPHYEIVSFSYAAKMIGGDYHFYRKLNENCSYFMVADISGKGVPAALITFMLSTVVRTIIANESNLDAGHILTETNKFIAKEMAKVGRFATAMLCIYDDSTNTMNYASAGHGDLYIYRKADRKFTPASNVFFPIGIEDDVVYRSAFLELFPGDQVVIVTDGITEAKNELEHDFGVTRLLNNAAFTEDLPADELILRLKKDIFSFVGKAEQYDDMTMLLFKKKA